MSTTTTKPPDTSFATRRIDVTFQRSDGVFSESGTDTVTLAGLRVAAQITMQGGAIMGALDLRIWGLRLALMNDLSQVNGAAFVVQVKNPADGSVSNVVTTNTVLIAASADGGTPATAFWGTISGALIDYFAAPQVCFHVNALSGYPLALGFTPPSSYPGAADVAVIFADMAGRFGYAFENNGVSGVFLSNPYFAGSPKTQIERCAAAANVNLAIDETAQTLAIWPQGGARGALIPLISPANGLIGYPVRTPIGVEFDMLYDPTIKFGGRVELKTAVPTANGVWRVIQLVHRLDARLPNGLWSSHVITADPKAPF